MVYLFEKLKHALESNENVMVVGVFSVFGSAPRGAGAKMLVTKNGRIHGTIGGGRLEHEAEVRATALLKRKSSDLQRFKLSPDNVEDLGMVCGGEVLLYYLFISCANIQISAFISYALGKLKDTLPSWLITCMTDTGGSQMGIYSEHAGFYGIDMLSGLSFADTPRIQRINGCDYLVEPLVRAGTVYVFGGGHVSQALVPLAARVGFRCVVLDDRTEFTKPELFPDAQKTCIANFDDIVKTVEITENDYVVIMTRGHQHDLAVQAQALRTVARYIGVIGSKSKAAYVFKQMLELGFTNADLARVKSPIGLDIKAETPEEIAVSIVAELIMVRAKAQRKE